MDIRYLKYNEYKYYNRSNTKKHLKCSRKTPFSSEGFSFFSNCIYEWLFTHQIISRCISTNSCCLRMKHKIYSTICFSLFSTSVSGDNIILLHNEKYSNMFMLINFNYANFKINQLLFIIPTLCMYYITKYKIKCVTGRYSICIISIFVLNFI